MKLPKLPKIDFARMERSRLKVTFIFGGAGFLLCFFPMYIIYLAAEESVFDISAPWIALSGLVTAVMGVSGYYLSRETARPSLAINNSTYLPSQLTDVTDKVLPNESEDPEDMPL